MTAPVRPRSELSAPPLPAATSVGEDVVRTWTLTARSDDDRALLVTAAVTTCEGFDRFEVTQNDSYVLVAAHVRSPGLLTYCVSNVPRVTAVSYVVELSEPLGSRPLLHAAASPAG
jgi:hypothetical protein